jgi:hypothetical protein
MIEKLKQIALAIALIGLGTIWSQFVMKSIQGNNSEAEMTQARAYEVIGDRSGQVIVKNKETGEFIYKFQMEAGVVIREILLLRNGKIVVASQKDRAAFWNLETGGQLATFPQRIYGFSHNEKQFLTYSEGKLRLYNYPKLTLACQLENVTTVRFEKFVFSANDHFLAVLFATGRPESDEYYPETGPLRRSIRYSKLFDINNCQENEEFSKLRIFQLGKFSNNSKFYDIENYPHYIESERRYVTANWRFDLMTNKLQKL